MLYSLSMKNLIFLLVLASSMTHAQLGSKEFFSKLNPKTMHLVDEFYDENIVFEDPLGQHKGRESIRNYYTKLYQGASMVKFEFEKQLIQENSEVLFWRMTLQSSKLNGGKEYSVSGNSYFVFSPTSKKCLYHRDYFDMGDFIYERIPLLKNIIAFVKSQLANK